MNRRSVVALALAGVLAQGCGAHDRRTRAARPPVDAQLSVASTRSGLTLSPDRIGAGPARLIAVNLTPRVLRLRLDGPGASSSTAGLAPGATEELISGELDLLLPPWKQRELHDAIPGSRLTVVPGAAHGVHLEFAVQFNKLVLSFLAEHPITAAAAA